MKHAPSAVLRPVAIFSLTIGLAGGAFAQNAKFHNAPASAKQTKNPYAGQASASEAGSKLYTRYCGACHGVGGRGTGNVPALKAAALKSVTDGEIFYIIKNGHQDMPPEGQRVKTEENWDLVNYVRALAKKTPESDQKTP